MSDTNQNMQGQMSMEELLSKEIPTPNLTLDPFKTEETLRQR